MTQENQRRLQGEQMLKQVLGTSVPEAPSPFRDATLDFVFSEVWKRPGLDLRSRMWITLTCVGAADAATPIRTYLRAALATGIATRDELDEYILHFAVYCGWPKASYLQVVLNDVVEELNKSGVTQIPPRETQPLVPAVSEQERIKVGEDWFRKINLVEPPPRNAAYYHNGILNFVFGEMWTRPQLDVRARRWITVAGCAVSDAEVPILSHVYAAMKSGDCSFEEMGEFVVHFGVYSGWAKAERIEEARQKTWAAITSGKSLI